MKRYGLTFAALVVSLGFLLGLVPVAAKAQSMQEAPFVGTWCAQGDPSKPSSIISTGSHVLLTNEIGSTSSGHVASTGGVPYIVAVQWGRVRGTLVHNGKRISWSNGTYWTRCSGHRHGLNLGGRWYFGGDPSKPCYIDQNGSALSLRNEHGHSATGSIVGKNSISTVWFGTTITGTVSANREKILWSNGTYWTR